MVICNSSLDSRHFDRVETSKLICCRWWIHPIFAFRDGIISSSNPRGGITFDTEGAYAITLTATDEVEGSTAERIIYAVSSNDPGKHRLFNSFLPVKTPVRVLRTHTLYSKWSPVVGIRYEGLYVRPGQAIVASADCGPTGTRLLGLVVSAIKPLGDSGTIQ